uniref:probable serine/threonine-protein kinase DDB_G0278521 n=1 Tax=Erigeron canadensis TaxID=72917 RepID=UPI001CB94384|nr:probable serine/threonine-protein kinase DDB_G0278521 [Erigeron canadensis]
MLATKNFSDDTFIAEGGFGKVYVGILTLSEKQIRVAMKRLNRQFGQGNREYLMEIQMLTCYRHKNLVSLVGFCDENGESILVYEHVKHGSLDRHLRNASELSWIQRLKISLGAARGFNYLHYEVGAEHRVLHRDIKSPNILLDENWEAKVADFGLSKIGRSNVEFTYVVTDACGTIGYIDPRYLETGILTKESDVYSFGVLLFEILSGRHAFISQDGRGLLANIAKQSCEKNTLDDIILPDLKNQMREDSLNVFTKAAYQCLKENRIDRPTMGAIVEKLEYALLLQVCNYSTTFIRVGTWGKQIAGQNNDQWSFKLEENHKLQKIIIDHGDVIYSLMFTTQCGGIFHTSNKVGGSAGGDIVSKVMLDDDEEIIDIKGTVATRGGNTVISSLTFVTNKRTHGPFGRASENVFTIPWEKGSLVGFYGFAGDFIDAIGVYLKADAEIMNVGSSGADYNPPGHNGWSYEIERNHHLKEIVVEHGHGVYSLTFTSQYKGLKYTSAKVGGWSGPYGEDKVSVVTLDWDEEIIGISGTVAVSEGVYAGYIVIASISFVTDKRTHGPYGTERGTPFTVQWEHGSVVGFYGRHGAFLDSIGVYLKAML